MVHHTDVSVVTIERFIIEQEKRHAPQATGELSGILYDLALAAKMIANKVRSAGLADILGSTDPRLVAVIVPHGTSTWFYKLTGDAPVVAQEKAAFVKFVRYSFATR